MKILGLRFANLNSLEGEWVIDFTRPEYVSDGIFAITGPTGSGKSTILDALCLALYGQTPRLGKITKSSNEIISRHAGECFAEATFSTAKGTFLSHWSQHRARRRTGGELQAQKHELSDAAGNILQSKLQESLSAVEELTGMDFERFTRSMLLAQGGFAAFLQADPDRRAPVLEQITGTEVYSVISMRVHDRQRSERAKLDLLRAETVGIRVLGEDDAAGLGMRLEQLLEAEREGQSKFEGLAASLRRLEVIGRLEAELAEVEGQSMVVDEEIVAFAPQESRLAFARHAESIVSRYSPLVVQRQELDRESAGLALNREQRLRLESETKLAVEEHAVADEAFRSAVAALAKSRPLHDQVLALDREVSEQRRMLEMRRQALDELEARVAGLEQERQACCLKLESERTEERKLRAWLDAHHADAGLEASLSGIRHALQELQTVEGRRAAAEDEVAVARKSLECALEEKSARELVAAASKANLAEAEQLLGNLRREMDDLLDGWNIKALRQSYEASRQRGQLLDEIVSLYLSGREFATKIADVDAGIAGQRDLKAGMEERLADARQLLQGAEREVGLCEENLRLADRVRRYDEERASLAEGAPCPLCGSTAHPYVSGSSCVPADDEATLRKAKDAMHARESAVRELVIGIAACATAIAQRNLRRDELERDSSAHSRRCLDLLALAGIVTPPENAEPVARHERDAVHGNAERLSRLVSDAETLEERIFETDTRRQSLLEAGNADQRNLEKAYGLVESSNADLRRLETAHEAVERDCVSRRKRLQGMLSPFEPVPESGVHDDELIGTLESRSECWRANDSRCRTLRELVIAGESGLARVDSQVDALRLDRQSRLESLAETERGVVDLGARRTGLFGERDPAKEQEKLNIAAESARDLLDRSRAELARSRQALESIETLEADRQAGIALRRKAVAKLESRFLSELQDKGFADEQAFLAARIEDDLRGRIEQESGELQRRKREFAARREERLSRLRQEKAARIDSRNADELSEELRLLRESMNTLLEEAGVIRRQLADNELAAAEQGLKAASIEAQSSECRRWELLHEIIGSADGKKFRNFAQGMTFEIMVTHANRQLARMTDRYQLVRDTVSPLELNVVDTWQAGEVRSTRNLSGGESFIVSLALALGLSQMSSRNVRVDSLFLDEGFGTLDEEALETALETLACLQQSGKLIGIISHVPALKERISTQIRVAPLTGGRSAISGPGVSRR
jgi:DNA repair protein SbcC/Rad50